MIHNSLTTMWRKACHGMILGTADELTIASLTAIKFDQTLRARSMEFELDISRDLWMTKGRFTTLVNDYLDPDQLAAFVEKVAQLNGKRPQLAQMLCRNKSQRHVSYKWGNCILAFTFRLVPQPTMVMHSRTTAVTRMGGLDLALAYHVMLAALAEKNDYAIEEVEFIWHVDSMQHSTLNGTPFFYAHGYDRLLHQTERYPDREYPALRLMRREAIYFDKLDAAGQQQKHGTRRRVREQRRAFIEGRLDRPAVPLHALSINSVLEDS